MNTIKITETTKKTSEIMNDLRAICKVYSYLNDEQLDKQFPVPREITTRYFRDSVDPDTETLGKSANEADPERKGITLRERLLLEIEYFKKYGTNLDIVGWTYCSGSRYSGGDVPSVDLDDGGVQVDWDSPDHSDSRSGLRSAQFPPLFDPQSSNPSPTLDEAIKIVKEAGLKVVRETLTTEIL